MKKCRQCAKPSTVHITEILDGQVQEIHLCESCAHDYLQPSDDGDSADDAETVALKLKEVANEEDLMELDHIVCPNCGI
ncbi:MAG: DNA helicase UvrBC, partial [Planctomycetaceae bacterium]